MTSFKQFLAEESLCIKRYRNKLILKNLWVVPLFVVLCFLVFKAEYLMLIKEDFNALLEAMMSVVPIALIVSCVYFFMIAFALKPSIYTKQIEAATGWINLSAEEQEELGRDMLEVYPTERRVDFSIKHISANNTPAKFVCGQKFAYLCGLSPYAIFVKIDDISRMEMSEQEIELKRFRLIGKRKQKLNFYLVSFCLKNIEKENQDDVDVNFGFFNKELRDHAYSMLKEQMDKNNTKNE